MSDAEDGLMIGLVWRELKVFVLAGVLILAIAYTSGSAPATLGWLFALLLVTLGIQIVKTIHTRKISTKQISTDPSAEDLRHEMKLLVQQVEGSAKNMLGHVHNELGQMRSLVSDAIYILNKSFNGLNQESQAQSAMVMEVLEGLDGIHEVIGGTMKDVFDITQRINHMTADAVKSLQFEDIVKQLTASSEKHLDYLESVLSAVDIGMHDLNSRELTVPEYIAGLHTLKLQIDQIEKELMSDAEKSVSQVDMRDGEIVMFK